MKHFVIQDFKYIVCIFSEISNFISSFEKPIKKNICIDWDYQISKCHSISENIKKEVRPYINLFNKHLENAILSERPCTSYESYKSCAIYAGYTR